MYEPTDRITTAAALLFRRKPHVDFDAFCAELNRALDLREDMQLSIGDARGPDFALLSSGPFHVLVTISRRRFPRRRMAAALASTITRQKVFDYEKAIAAHTCHVTVHVGSGAEFEGEGIGEARAASGQTSQTLPMPVGFRAAVLRLAAELLATDQTSAVHWEHSDMILDASELGAIAGSDVPVLQAIHPLPLKGADAHGIIAAHSEHFAERTIQIDPAPRPFAKSVSMALSMVVEKEAGRLPLAHGDVLETTAGETLYVRHEAPCARWPAGRICLGPAQPNARAPICAQINADKCGKKLPPSPMQDAVSDGRITVAGQPHAQHHVMPSVSPAIDVSTLAATPAKAPPAPAPGNDAFRHMVRDTVTGDRPVKTRGNKALLVMAALGASFLLFMEARNLTADAKLAAQTFPDRASAQSAGPSAAASVATDRHSQSAPATTAPVSGARISDRLPQVID
ncbi:MAG: hypothetical protein AAFY38_02655 [Pseudomonadota bacterium]